jgi:hypothetical protein
MASDADRPVIVAGVDGSQCSLEALRWAARQSELTGAEFHAVMAWSLPEIYSYTPRDFQSDARKALEDAIEQALGLGPRAPVVAQVVEGRPARGTGRGGGQRGRVGLSGARRSSHRRRRARAAIASAVLTERLAKAINRATASIALISSTLRCSAVPAAISGAIGRRKRASASALA